MSSCPSAGAWKLLLREICRASSARKNLHYCFSETDERFLFLNLFPKFSLKSNVAANSIHLNELTEGLCS